MDADLEERALSFLRDLWSQGSGSRLQTGLLLRRVATIAIVSLLAWQCERGALYLARWPKPYKYGGGALFVLAAGLIVWMAILVGKVFWQLRLKRLLIVFGIGYALWAGIWLLTTDSRMPLHENVLLAIRQPAATTLSWTYSVGRALVEAPEKFRYAYTGYRRPLVLPGMETKSSPSILASPIPSARPAGSATSAPRTTTAAAVRMFVSGDPAANVRSGPSEASPTVTTLPKGTEVQVYEVSGDWRKIKCSQLADYAWIHDSMISAVRP
jgi:hypothetical protein